MRAYLEKVFFYLILKEMVAAGLERWACVVVIVQYFDFFYKFLRNSIEKGEFLKKK